MLRSLPLLFWQPTRHNLSKNESLRNKLKLILNILAFIACYSGAERLHQPSEEEKMLLLEMWHQIVHANFIRQAAVLEYSISLKVILIQ
jgi:hypothetical protein